MGPAAPAPGAAGSAAERWLGAAARRPVLALALLLAAATLPALSSRDLWFGDEVRHASVLRHLLEDGDALALRMNGEPYPDKPPLWFWAVAGLARLSGSQAPWVWFLASAASGALVLAATVALARAAGQKGAVPFVAGLVVLASPLFLALARTTRMDLAFSAAIVASQACLLRAWGEERAGGRAVLGGLLAGVAALVKGPYGFLLPYGAVAALALWRGETRRLLRRDLVLGAALALALPAAWLAALAASAGPEAVARVTGQLAERATSGLRHAQPFWFYAVCLPLAWAPWTLAAAGADLRSWASLAAWRARAAARRTAPAGVAFLVLSVASGLVLLTVPRAKFEIYLMPLLPALAVLTARLLVEASAPRARRALTAVAAGVLALSASVLFANAVHPWPIVVRGAGVVAVLLLATGGRAFLAARRGAREAATLVLGVGGLAAFLAASLLLVPSLDPVLSPRGPAEEIARWAARGCEPLAYRTYPGAYAYYAGRTVPDARGFDEVERLLATERPVVLAMPRKHWERNAAALSGLRVVHEQWLEAEVHLVLVRE